MKRILLLILLIAVSQHFKLWSQAESNGEKSEAISAIDLLSQYDQLVKQQAASGTKVSKAYSRQIEFMRERLNPKAEIADPSIFLSAIQDIADQKEALGRLKTGQAWSPVGPFEKPDTYSSAPSYGMGRINCITFHPTDPNTYWIGVAQGGVWKTTDGGDHYIPLTDDLPLMRISDIAVDPINPDIMYISVCDYAYIGVALNTDGRKRHSHYGLGVYKTTNGGQDWQATGLSFGQETLDETLIRRVLISPDDSNILLAAGVNGIYKSNDAGDNWTQIREDLIWDIEQDFNNGNIVYATPGYVVTLGKGQAGLLKSTDFGETWTALNPGFPGNQSIARVEIGLTPETSDYIYLVATDLSGGFYGFYRSVDAGLTWETRMDYTSGNNILYWYIPASGQGGQGWYDLSILVDPKDKERVFVGGINMWGTENGGTTWSPCSFWVMYNGFTLHADHHQYKYNPLDQKYYACQDGGVARTSAIVLGPMNSQATWPTIWEEKSNGMAITSFYRLGLAEMFPGYVIAGAQDNSTFYNENGKWVNIMGGDGMEAMIDPNNPKIVYGSSQYGNWSRSDDGGSSFTGIRPTYQEDGGWTTPMIMNPNNPDELFAGYGNVWKSTNKGSDWTKISNFPIVQGFGKPAIISALAMCPTDNNYLYVAKRIHHQYNSPSSFWRTQDGSHWDLVTAGLPDELYFTYIAVDDDDPLSVWVTCSGFSDGNKVFHSSDGGSSWQNVSFNLPNIPVNTIVHQNGSAENIVYIGTDAGVFYTKDDLGRWELYSTDLPNVIISELEIHYPTKKIYAASFGRGIWMADVLNSTGTGIINITDSHLDVFPNPSEGDLLINFSGINPGNLVIQVVDIQGKEILNSSSRNETGSGKISINLNVPAGVYFIRLWAGDQLRTRRILIN